MAAKLQNSLTIWVAEDNQNDQFFLRHAFSELASRATLRFFERSEDLIAALNEEFTPNLIVTDLKMPGLGGYELVRFVKNDKRLKHIPVIVFSGSNDPADIENAYSLFANSYVSKPNDVAGYEKCAASFTAFWLEQASLAA